VEIKIRKFINKYDTQFRFATVGVSSTIVDFGILFILVGFGQNEIFSNYISTFIAMAFSFILNKKYTFKDDGKNHTAQIFRFLIVTLIGLWVIQPIIIWGLVTSLQSVPVYAWLILLFAKCWATGASMVWNYFTYSRLVFNKGAK
jgi:putative flippase GtrA